jgi:TPR repeat protein
MALRAALITVIAGAVLFETAIAEPFGDGLAAFSRGDYATALRILNPLAEQGHVRAQFYLGYMYDQGWGVRQNSVQAALWFRRAADQGDALSQDSLGSMHLTGVGVPRSYAEAMKWSMMAARQGDASAQLRLGSIYANGWGVPQNYILAYMWFSVSAAKDREFEGVAKGDLDKFRPHMAPSQIAEAQKLAQQCLESNFKNCNNN